MATAGESTGDKTGRMKKSTHVASIAVEGSSHLFSSPVLLQIERTGSVYHFYLKPVTVNSVQALVTKSGQLFSLATPQEVTELNYQSAWNPDKAIAEVMHDIQENFGLNFPLQKVTEAIKTDRQKFMAPLRGRWG